MKPQERLDSLAAFDDIYKASELSDVGALVLRHEQERGRFLSELKTALTAGGEDRPKALEVGCGTAVDLMHVSEARKCVACGADVSGEALKVARRVSERFPGVAAFFVRADAHRLPFASGVFDLVFSQGVLEHLADDRAAVEEQSRVLKKGGKLVISVPQRYTAYTVMKRLKMRRGSWPWGYEREYSCAQLRALTAQTRLSVKSVFGYAYWLHPMEPMWVARSLAAKFQKINPARAWKFFGAIEKAYDRCWSRIESRFGHLFMRNVVIVLEK